MKEIKKPSTTSTQRRLKKIKESISKSKTRTKRISTPERRKQMALASAKYRAKMLGEDKETFLARGRDKSRRFRLKHKSGRK